MGIDYDGGMIIGCDAEDVEVPEEFDDVNEWLDDNGLISMSKWYDADESGQCYGFEVEDVLVSDIDDDWLKDIKEKAKKFKDLTGCDAYLIGMQNIW